MNEELVMKMAEPNIKNGSLTYAMFDKIYEVLSRREQYEVCEILYRNGIELVDSFEPDEGTLTTDLPDIDDTIDARETDDLEPILDDSLFKDMSGSQDYLFFSADIKQSNDNLIRLVHNGNTQARQDLCIKNEMLVRKYANAYYRHMGNDLELDDLVQVGFIGLLTAADRFEFSKNSSFSTYAVIWIKQAISRFVFDQGFRIRIPVHVMEKLKAAIKLDNEYAFSGLDYQQRIKRIAEEMSMTEDKIEELFTIKYTFLDATSLDTPVGEEEDVSLGDFIPSEEEIDPEEQSINSELSHDLGKALATLTPREERVLRMRFGLYDGRRRTLEEIGREFNVTRERIRQIEAKALRKLKHPSRSKKLKEYLTD